MGKMISVQSIAVAVAATGMTPADESRLFRFTIKHSVLLMVVMGDHLDAVRLRVPAVSCRGAVSRPEALRPETEGCVHACTLLEHVLSRQVRWGQVT